MSYYKDEIRKTTTPENGLNVNVKFIVCCEEGFYRKGNVDIVCKKYNIPQIKSIDKLIQRLKQYG